MIRCTGQLGHHECSVCARLAPDGLMRPIEKLVRCNFFEKKNHLPKPPAPEKLIPFAGKRRN